MSKDIKLETPTVIFDLDDVLFNTAEFISKRMEEYLKNKKDFDKVDRAIDIINQDKTTSFLVEERYLAENYPELAKVVSHRVYKYGLLEGKFIPLLSPNVVLREFIEYFLIPNGYKVSVCTHRKSLDPNGLNTIAALAEHFPDVEFTDIYVLDKNEHPDKIKFLNARHDNYILVDDNPVHVDGVLDYIPNVVIWNKAHSFYHYIRQKKANDVIKLKYHINNHFYEDPETNNETRPH